MGTTLTAVYLDDADLAVAHVGDSRAYLFRDGKLTRLTQDHSLVEELVRAGKLTEEQAAEHPQRSIITRALGVEPQVEVDTWTYPARAGDVVLLCSDGLTSMISEEQIAAILAEESDLDRAGERLIDEANAAGGRDNITVVLFRLEDAGGAVGDADDATVVGPQSGHRVRGRARGHGAAAPGEEGSARRGRRRAVRQAGRGHPDGAGAAAQTQPPAGASHPAAGADARPPPPGGHPAAAAPRFAKPLAALVAIVIVLVLVGGGGYLASRQLFFVGTNAQGVVTIYRGFPYDLPLGINLYEPFYVSGVPIADVPAPRGVSSCSTISCAPRRTRSASCTPPSVGQLSR